MENIKDAILWKSLKKGDMDAFAALFKTYYPKLFHYGIKISGDTSMTEDSLQDFFLYVYEHRENLSDLNNISPYLFSSFRRFLIKKLQKNSKVISINEVHDYFVDIKFTPEELLTHQEQLNENNKHTAHLLNKLTNRQREAIYLKYYCELKTIEIATIMEVNYQSVVNTIHKALKSLKQEAAILDLIKS